MEKHKRKICPFYQTGRKCTNKDFCCEQYEDTCVSHIYYIMDLECQVQRLKEENLELQRNYNIAIERLQKYEEDADVQCALFSDIDKHKQVLQEIKKIAKHYSKMCCGAGGQSMTIQDRHYGMAQVGKEILQKISEVEE